MSTPLVAIVMGSDSDWPTMSAAKDILEQFGVASDVQVLSAHRTPEAMIEWGKQARSNGVSVIIAGAGGAAHLPGMLASVTSLPVIGVPIALTQLDGLDSLLSIVQMPGGVPVATVSIGNSTNAALLAVRMLSISSPVLAAELDKYSESLADLVAEKNAALKDSLS
ncbi:MAG: 5-(carboxyamino)imidazole ribonucleotide mutase [Actinobacteria bacterium]|nr:5-(carboxyamino)imidazole ribonucleotide mutase [Actinomycetota bacterium]MUH52913.1 5-(carboxyamino)imidazole ribonucleotide mutase [Actinomycetota bacterium]